MKTAGEISVVEILPDLSFWARTMRPDPRYAAELVEETLELAILHMEELNATSDMRRWFFQTMVNTHLARRK